LNLRRKFEGKRGKPGSRGLKRTANPPEWKVKRISQPLRKGERSTKKRAIGVKKNKKSLEEEFPLERRSLSRREDCWWKRYQEQNVRGDDWDGIKIPKIGEPIRCKKRN